MMGLIDSTLREGEQMSGVYFSPAQKLDIIRHLHAIGIEEIELGIAAMSPDIAELMLQARRVAPTTRLALWCRGLVSDIRESAELYPDVLSISLPVSDVHITKRLGKDRDWVLRQIGIVLNEARQCGVPFLSLGLEDVTRADMSFLAQVLRRAETAGVDRVRLSDTLGVGEPTAWAKLIRAVHEHVAVQVGVHTHNDFGMATANAIAALEAGADWADVTILGLGERAGCARLEEVVGYTTLCQQTARYDTTRLQATCQAVARMAGISIAPHHPMIGQNIFRCESGIHLDGLAKDTTLYEPFAPERVNAVRTTMLGKKIGTNAALTRMHALGFPISRDEAVVIVRQVRDVAQRLGRPLTDAEFIALLEEQSGPPLPSMQDQKTHGMRAAVAHGV